MVITQNIISKFFFSLSPFNCIANLTLKIFISAIISPLPSVSFNTWINLHSSCCSSRDKQRFSSILLYTNFISYHLHFFFQFFFQINKILVYYLISMSLLSTNFISNVNSYSFIAFPNYTHFIWIFRLFNFIVVSHFS